MGGGGITEGVLCWRTCSRYFSEASCCFINVHMQPWGREGGTRGGGGGVLDRVKMQVTGCVVAGGRRERRGAWLGKECVDVF